MPPTRSTRTTRSTTSSTSASLPCRCTPSSDSSPTPTTSRRFTSRRPTSGRCSGGASSVEQAIATYKTVAQDRKLLGALTLFGATPEISFYFRVDGDTVVGYDAKQAEIVRVPIKEPIVIRPVYDATHKAYRTNIT